MSTGSALWYNFKILVQMTNENYYSCFYLFCTSVTIMWNYIKGVKPPTKRKQTPEEKKAYDHDYEHKWHKQAFKDDWKNGQPWL